MERYLYHGEIIEYLGFMIDRYYCFQYLDDKENDTIIYLSKTKIETLEKIINQ